MLALLMVGCSGCPADPAEPTATPPADVVAETASDAVADTPEPEGGLPCEVQTFVATWCTPCHSEPLKVGAPMPLIDRADFLRPALSDPSRTVAEVSVVRLTTAALPMPPIGILDAAERAPFEAWVAAGLPAATCDVEPGPPPESVCTSESYWTGGVQGGSPLMRPGAACIACHEAGNAPGLVVAGTVYPTVREPEDCNGVAGVTVELTDATGEVITMTTNQAGNFFRRGGSAAAFAPPATAKVIANGVERTMLIPVFSGDCNSCHTEEGLADAPGRIVAP